jgi:putative SOS response-associated peptidase YedK
MASMPVLLTGEDAYATWLNPETPGRGTVEHLFRPTDPTAMACRPAE